MKQPVLTVEQYSLIFDCVTYRLFELEAAKQDHPHAAEFLTRKMDELNAILEEIGPYSV